MDKENFPVVAETPEHKLRAKQLAEQKSRGLRDFVSQARNSSNAKTEADSTEIAVLSKPKILRRAVTKPVEPEQKYITLSCQDGYEFVVPADVVFLSGWLKRLFIESAERKFKEHQQEAVCFPEFDRQVLEMVIGWMCQELLLNGPSDGTRQRPRTAFHFPLPGDLLMDVLYVSHFLEVTDLVNLCVSMVAEHLEEVSHLDHLPPDLTVRVVSRISSPANMVIVERRPDFRQLHIETGFWWENAFRRTQWTTQSATLRHRTRNQHAILDFLASDSPSPPQQAVCNWRRLFLERYLQAQAESLFLSADGELLRPTRPASEADGGVGDFWQLVDLFSEHVASFRFPMPLLASMCRAGGLDRFSHLTAIDLSGIDLMRCQDVAGCSAGDFNRLLVSYYRQHPQCTALGLSRCSLTDTAVVKGLLDRTGLATLDLSSNALTRHGLSSLCRELACSSSCPLQTLDVHDNPIGLEGMLAIVQECSLNDVPLRVADFGRCGVSVGDAPVIMLSALSRLLRLETLLLDENPLAVNHNDTPLPADLLLAFFRQLPPLLQTLDLSQARLANSAVEALCTALLEKGDRCNLKVLNLGGNNVTSNAIQMLAVFLSANATLLSLDLSQNDLTAESFAVLSGGVASSRSLRYLDLDRNYMNDQAALQFATRLTREPVEHGLRFVSVDLNRITPPCLERFEDALGTAGTTIIRGSQIMADLLWRYRGRQAVGAPTVQMVGPVMG